MRPCGKRCHTKREAEAALNDILKKGRQHSREKRIYYCQACHSWHLTSKEHKEEVKQEEVPLAYTDRWKHLLNTNTYGDQ